MRREKKRTRREDDNFNLSPAFSAPRNDGVRFYLAGTNILKHEQELKELLEDSEPFFKSKVTRGKVGALGMWLGK